MCPFFGKVGRVKEKQLGRFIRAILLLENELDIRVNVVFQDKVVDRRPSNTDMEMCIWLLLE